MNREQAKQIAEAYLERERLVTGDHDRWATDRQAITRCLEALLPDLEGPWGIVELAPLAAPDEKFLILLGVESADDQAPRLVTAQVERREDEHSSWPQVITGGHGYLFWGLPVVSDAIHRDHGAEVLTREWTIQLGDDRCLLATEEIIVNEPSPGPDEVLARDLAAIRGREIHDVSASREGLEH